jgi:hypothetical protein
MCIIRLICQANKCQSIIYILHKLERDKQVLFLDVAVRRCGMCSVQSEIVGNYLHLSNKHMLTSFIMLDNIQEEMLV